MSEAKTKQVMDLGQKSIDYVLRSQKLLGYIADYNNKNKGDHDPVELEKEHQGLQKLYEPLYESLKKCDAKEMEIIKIKDVSLRDIDLEAEIQLRRMITSNYDFFKKWVQENNIKLKYAKIK